MKIPKYSRGKPKRIGEIVPPPDVLAEMARAVRYVGSLEHKSGPSFAGHPAPRADATICDPSFADRQDMLTEWLRSAILSGKMSEIADGERFPRYVWWRYANKVYEARLVNREQGHYKGYELLTVEYPEGV